MDGKPGKPEQEKDGAKAKYEPPRIESEKIFEESALVSCGKRPGQGACAASNRDS
ncbi:MAG: hypothetical protein HYT87_13215 [Nitrospirae bacterium]|nr:hypothetical protein [Nitrospirota bacterium]